MLAPLSPDDSDGDSDGKGWVLIDLDATLVDAHSEKEGAQPTFKRGFRVLPMLAIVDHGRGGIGECVGALLRPGKATANDITVLTDALAQLSEDMRGRVVVRGDRSAPGRLLRRA